MSRATISSPYVRIDFLVPDRDDAYEQMIDFAERMEAAENCGWVRRFQSDIQGRVWVMRNRQAREVEVIHEVFGHSDAALQFVPDPEAPAKVRMLGAFRLLKPGLETKNPRAVIEAVGHRGLLRCWAVDPSVDDNRASLDVRVDGEFVGRTRADRLRLDLLQKGIGDGEHGAEFQLPTEFLDGGLHEIEIVNASTASRRTMQGSASRHMQMPKRFSIPTSWRRVQAPASRADAETLASFYILRDRVIAGEGMSAVEALRKIWDDNPELVFLDAGLREAANLSGSTFLSYRERANGRLAAWSPDLVCALGRDCCKLAAWDAEQTIARCPLLIRRFVSKAFIKEYAKAVGIPVAKTFLVTNDYDEIRRFDFPEDFVIKPDVGSKKCTFVYSGGFDLFTRKAVSLDDILQTVRAFMQKENNPYFVIEELLQGRNSNAEPAKAVEYSIYVFGGKTRIVQVVDRNIFESQVPEYFQQGHFSPNWVPAPHRIRKRAEYLNNFARPARLEEMIAIANKVGRDCSAFVRVDFYDSSEGVRMGEVTTFPEGGRGFTEFGDLVFSQIWEAFPDREVALYRASEIGSH